MIEQRLMTLFDHVLRCSLRWFQCPSKSFGSLVCVRGRTPSRAESPLSTRVPGISPGAPIVSLCKTWQSMQMKRNAKHKFTFFLPKWSVTQFSNSAVTKPSICAHIVTEMASHLSSCSIAQVLSRPKVSKSPCVISQEPFLYSVRTLSSKRNTTDKDPPEHVSKHLLLKQEGCPQRCVCACVLCLTERETETERERERERECVCVCVCE